MDFRPNKFTSLTASYLFIQKQNTICHIMVIIDTRINVTTIPIKHETEDGLTSPEKFSPWQISKEVPGCPCGGCCPSQPGCPPAVARGPTRGRTGRPPPSSATWRPKRRLERLRVLEGKWSNRGQILSCIFSGSTKAGLNQYSPAKAIINSREAFCFQLSGLEQPRKHRQRHPWIFSAVFLKLRKVKPFLLQPSPSCYGPVLALELASCLGIFLKTQFLHRSMLFSQFCTKSLTKRLLPTHSVFPADQYIQLLPTWEFFSALPLIWYCQMLRVMKLQCKRDGRSCLLSSAAGTLSHTRNCVSGEENSKCS